ncbi:MAG: Eco29kI family restriction endonuclease [Candidatus Brocadiae bacterium]|nr:Eco29kI family restriction endonuclease [Candidatus Brocadiia bacterium]
MHEETEQPFDPLDYVNIARTVVEGLLRRPLQKLGEIPAFFGAGIYAIYYTGPFTCYRRIAERPGEIPIYVGKAVPPGARKGGEGLAPLRTMALSNRLKQHGRSLGQAENLQVQHFLCRYLVVEPVWIRLAEQVLVERFRPLWNCVVDGFGNHPPGRGRSSMRRPRWDIVHPGRPWALELAQRGTVEDIMEQVRAHLDSWSGFD